MTQIKFELSPKQCDFIRNANHRWNGKIGATQCGKTFIDTTYVIPNRILERKGKRGLNVILGVSKGTIERNVLEPMRTFWGDKLISDINSQNMAVIFGEIVYCLGAEKVSQVSKLRGSQIKYCYCDEMVDFNEEVFQLLKSRLSLSYSMCDFTGNPSYPGHWAKKFVDSDIDIFMQGWTIYDNPFLDKQVVEELEKEYKDTIYFDRYILGKWVKAEGLAFYQFKKDQHYLSPDEYARLQGGKTNSIKYLIVGGDSASEHDATALVPLAVFANGKTAVLDIFYHNPKKDGPLSNAQMTPMIRQWYEDLIRKYSLNRGQVTFYSAFDCASVTSDLVLTLRDNLPEYYNINKYTKKDIDRTTRVVNNVFYGGKCHILNYGGIYNYFRRRFEVRENPLVEELESVIWDKNGKTYDNTVPNDAADAFRYAINLYFSNPDNLWDKN